MKRPGSSASQVARFLSKASDDACCAWLCNTAGTRTKNEDAGLSQALKTLAPWAVVPIHKIANPDMLRRVS